MKNDIQFSDLTDWDKTLIRSMAIDRLVAKKGSPAEAIVEQTCEALHAMGFDLAQDHAKNVNIQIERKEIKGLENVMRAVFEVLSPEKSPILKSDRVPTFSRLKKSHFAEETEPVNWWKE